MTITVMTLFRVLDCGVYSSVSSRQKTEHDRILFIT